MKKSTFGSCLRGILLVFAAFGILAAAYGITAAGEVTIAGSSTVKPIVDKASSGFSASHSGTKLVIGGGGSGHGVKAAASGEVAIGMASRALKDSEKAAYPNLKAVKFAIDGIGIIVHKSNPVSQLTTDQVRDIFTGKISNWKEVGGKDAPIELLSAGSQHGTYEVFCEHFGFEAGEDAGMITFTANGASAKAKSLDGNKKVLAGVMTKPNAISYASLGIALTLAEKGAPVKAVALDGVAPEPAHVVDGQYKLQRALYFLTNGEAAGEAAAFIEYMLGSKGQELAKEDGFIPVR